MEGGEGEKGRKEQGEGSRSSGSVAEDRSALLPAAEVGEETGDEETDRDACGRARSRVEGSASNASRGTERKSCDAPTDVWIWRRATSAPSSNAAVPLVELMTMPPAAARPFGTSSRTAADWVVKAVPRAMRLQREPSSPTTPAPIADVTAGSLATTCWAK